MTTVELLTPSSPPNSRYGLNCPVPCIAALEQVGDNLWRCDGRHGLREHHTWRWLGDHWIPEEDVPRPVIHRIPSRSGYRGGATYTLLAFEGRYFCDCPGVRESFDGECVHIHDQREIEGVDR